MRGLKAMPGRPAVFAFAAALLALALIAPAAGARPAGAGNDGRPNILVVMTDDMATADLKLMPKTRRLLGDQGTTFADAIDSYPLCCPARATFITGQYAHNHGVAANFAPYGWYGFRNRGNTLPQWMRRAGYRTALIGKWLNGYGSKDAHGEIPRGFDIWRGLLDVSAYDYFNYVMNIDGKLRTWGDPEFAMNLVKFSSIQVDDIPDTFSSILAQLRKYFGNPPYSYWGAERAKDYSPDVTGRITEKLIRSQRSSRKPFFIWWAPAAPHREDVSATLLGKPGPDPRPPARYAERSKRFTLPRPPSFNEADISDKGFAIRNAAKPLTDTQIADLELDYQGRAGSMLAVDDRVADLVKALRETGQLRNTVIMFVSDNGWLQGQHRITGDKYLPYDESLRVPLIIRGPGVPAGQTVQGQVSNVDFAPTILDLAGARAGRKVDGVSLVPTMRKPAKRPDRVLVIEALTRLFVSDTIPNNAWDRPYQGVRTDRYTYFVWTETGEEELYDRRRDPYELTNVAADPAYASIRADLAAKSRRLRNCGGSACNAVAP